MYTFCHLCTVHMEEGLLGAWQQGCLLFTCMANLCIYLSGTGRWSNSETRGRPSLPLCLPNKYILGSQALGTLWSDISCPSWVPWPHNFFWKSKPSLPPLGSKPKCGLLQGVHTPCKPKPFSGNTEDPPSVLHIRPGGQRETSAPPCCHSLLSLRGRAFSANLPVVTKPASAGMRALLYVFLWDVSSLFGTSGFISRCP